MSEEKLYAVKNDEGEYWDFSGNDIFCSLAATRCPTTRRRSLATSTANKQGGHVVELVEAPAKDVVSEEEAEMLELAKNKLYQEAGVIYHYVKDHGGWRLGNDLGDRLMRAYVNGYTVETEKKYNVKVPHMVGYWYTKCGNNELAPANALVTDYVQFTDSEIIKYGLQDCEKVWCDSDD